MLVKLKLNLRSTYYKYTQTHEVHSFIIRLYANPYVPYICIYVCLYLCLYIMEYFWKSCVIPTFAIAPWNLCVHLHCSRSFAVKLSHLQDIRTNKYVPYIILDSRVAVSKLLPFIFSFKIGWRISNNILCALGYELFI